MDRNREARRAMMVTSAGTNGLSRRRHRSNSLRDSPEEDGVGAELQETVRLRERKKERERDRERSSSSRSKRRRGGGVGDSNRLMMHREDAIGDDTSEEDDSLNDDHGVEDEDDDDRMLPPPSNPSSSSFSNHHHHHPQRKSFPPPPPSKIFRAPWKPADDHIGVSVPRKARSASTKRGHDWSGSGPSSTAGAVVGGEQVIHRQASTSPVRTSVVVQASTASPSRISPSSSNISIRKKMKPANGGSKHRQPLKSPSKSSPSNTNLSASNQDEIEIEIAEVLYGMMRQPQGGSGGAGGCPARPDGGTGATNSSPVSNSFPLLTQNSSSSNTLVTVTAPKRKRPRPLLEENSRSSVMVKAETEQLVKVEAVEKSNTGSVAENGEVSLDLSNHSRVGPPASSEQIQLDSKPLTAQLQHQHVNESRKDENRSASPRNGSPETNREDSVPSKLNLMVTESEGKREEKFQIDLMAPPPQTKSSPEREGETSIAAPETKKMVPSIETEIKTVTTIKEDEKRSKTMKEVDMRNAVETDEKHVKRAILEVAEQCKPIIVNKDRFSDLQLDLAKNVTKQTQLQQQQTAAPLQTKSSRDEHNIEKKAQSPSSLPMQMPLASWPGGFSPMGYMPPLQGVMPIDGRNVSAATVQPPQMLLNQSRPKRCATHCYIARNISYHQQFTRMNPFWPAAAGNASLYGAKPCNLNVIPSTELHANFGARNGNSVQDKGHANAANHATKEKGSHTPNNTDAAQRKQVVLQQTAPSGAPNNILHGPAYIFPLSQQQAAAASARSISGRTVSTTGAGSASSNSSAIAVGASAAAAMTFNYPNVPANETQYLAILPNNGYPFPIPANVGASPAAYRGPHAQAMPFFNGSFYSSQMLLPGQQQQQSSPQGLQIQHSSGGLPSAQKHLQNQQQQQQQRSESNGANSGSGSGSLHQTFQVPKNRSSQSAQHQNQHISLPQQSRLLESKGGAQDNPSASDNHVPHANMSVYGQNFAMPIHAPNFALMTPVALGGTGGPVNNSHNEKKLQQSQQQQGMKPGMDSMPSQAFAVTFTSLNNGGGPTPGLDISSMAAQSHAILQNFSDTANRQGYQFLTASAAVQASQQKKNIHVPEGKSGGGGASDNSNPEEERKSMAAKSSAKLGQSIAFSRSDAADSSVGNVIDSSARSLNLVSGSGRTSGSLVSGPMNNASSPSSQQRQQLQQHQQHQQLIQLHKQQQQQQQFTAMTARNKMPATGNGNVYLDHLPSSSAMAASKFPSAFPQNLVQSNSGSPTQSPQWKNSSRTTTSQAHSPSMSSSTSSSQKNIPQQQGRPQQGHMSISFGGNPKSSASPQVHPPPGSSSQTPSPAMVGSPTTSSISKGASGSPRTTASNPGNRTGQASTFSSSASQQGKNSPTVPSRKSSPVGGKNVPSILGNPHITSSSSSSIKPQLSQQLQHNQLPKQGMQQGQLIFSNHYMQPSQGPHSTGSNASSAPSATPGAYYIQRQGGQKQSQGPSSTTSSGMLSLYPPVSLANASSVASAKTVAAGNNMKGGVPQGIIHAPQFASVNQQLMPAGFPYVHSMPTVKPVEQKQQADE